MLHSSYYNKIIHQIQHQLLHQQQHTATPIQICHITAKQVRKSIKKGEQFYLLFVRKKKSTNTIEFNNINATSTTT